MKRIKKEELSNIYAGQSSGLWLSLGAGIIFLIGLIDGMVRPLKCNN